MRPLAFDDPGDGEAWNRALEYRLGRHLIVAPVTEPGATRWEVYLPRGRWVDLWTGRAVEGPEVALSEAPLTQIPVFIRAGEAGSLRGELQG